MVKARTYFAIGFVLLSLILVWLLSNPPREHLDNPAAKIFTASKPDDALVRIDKIETHDKQQDGRIDKLEKEFIDSKSRISEGEKQANAAIGSAALATTS